VQQVEGVGASVAMEWPADKVERWALDRLVPAARNARTHSDEQIAQIAASIREWGWTNPVLVDEAGGIIAGHGRVLAAKALGISEAPVMVARGWSEAQRRAYLIADNKLGLNASWDMDILKLEMGELKQLAFEMPLIGFSDAELGSLFSFGANGEAQGGGVGSLADKFMVAPFSVLNAREGWWQQRKRAWIALGIQSELGRGENALGFSETILSNGKGRKANAQPAGGGGGVWKEFNEQRNDNTGTSIFDPVLAELVYRWFSPPDGTVLDPFAGGSVRGIVASKLGRGYVGVDLRQEQVAANEAQAEAICAADERSPIWHVGDSGKVVPRLDTSPFDLIFSCPPYGDLEIYSDLVDDLANMDYGEFARAYSRIIAASVARLAEDRFACFVVGDFRDERGYYRNFVGDTVVAFQKAGAKLYNEIVLVTAAGSLPLRAGKQFSTTRKVGKTHQNVLVFCKGDPRRATEACGAVEIDEALFADIAAAGELADDAPEIMGGQIE
jgi:DNA modification methylase